VKHWVKVKLMGLKMRLVTKKPMVRMTQKVIEMHWVISWQSRPLTERMMAIVTHWVTN